jgi:hypothetical protein
MSTGKYVEKESDNSRKNGVKMCIHVNANPNQHIISKQYVPVRINAVIILLFKTHA